VRPLLTVREVATCLGANDDRVRYLVSTGQLKAVRLSARSIRFDQRDVELYRTSAAPLLPIAPAERPALMGTVYFVADLCSKRTNGRP
jgi:excisionase family DNA binding protein